MQLPGCVSALVFTVTLLVAAWPASGGMPRPAGVPDLLDPAVQAHFVPLSVARLNGDSDFPVVLLGNTNLEFPQFLLVIIDARNGKETWSFQEDATIFFLLLADAKTYQEAFLDEGFAANGKPSGKFIAARVDGVGALLVQLRESHRRFVSPGRLTTPAIWFRPQEGGTENERLAGRVCQLSSHH